LGTSLWGRTPGLERRTGLERHLSAESTSTTSGPSLEAADAHGASPRQCFVVVQEAVRKDLAVRSAKTPRAVGAKNEFQKHGAIANYIDVKKCERFRRGLIQRALIASLENVFATLRTLLPPVFLADHQAHGNLVSALNHLITRRAASMRTVKIEVSADTEVGRDATSTGKPWDRLAGAHGLEKSPSWSPALPGRYPLANQAQQSCWI
jgi:hypothetical protein